MKSCRFVQTNSKFNELCARMPIKAVGNWAKSIGLSTEELKSLETTNISLEYIFNEVPFYVNTPCLLNKESSLPFAPFLAAILPF
ncbi:tRNA-dependent cyclodipeptide synthase [Bartonella callosciuri]|uniref:tRNA-dependent cyclodipeptide synthase n=1 Tax=Bartonella callosciuri TaxID=686223 RepID=UPI003CCCB756